MDKNLVSGCVKLIETNPNRLELELQQKVALQSINRARRISARRTYRQCPCCQDDLPSHTRKPTNVSRKRKRAEKTSSSSPPAELLTVASPSPQPSTDDVDRLSPRLSATIRPEDLPEASNVTLDLQPSTAPLQDDGPLVIHNYSVEEYQRIYKEVVGDMLRYKNGNVRPYSVALGRAIKQRLWDRLNQPTTTTSTTEDGRVRIDVSYGSGVSPPQYDVDISEEPPAHKTQRKRSKKLT